MDELGKTKTTYYVTTDGVRKRRVEILIREDLAKILFARAVEEYGKGRGSVSALIERLLEEYFFPRDHGESESESRVEKVFKNIIRLIAEIRNTDPDRINEVTESEVLRAVSSLRGSDPRTIRKWLNIFLQNGYLEHVGGREPRRIFRINKPLDSGTYE